jgi:hypothetical protein
VLLLFSNGVMAGYPAIICRSVARRAFRRAAYLTVYLYDRRLA